MKNGTRLKRTKLNPISKKTQARKQKWNELVKRLIEERAHGRCEECHELPDFRGLHGHHIIYRSQGGEDTEENCIVLCGRCHDLAHGIKDS